MKLSRITALTTVAAAALALAAIAATPALAQMKDEKTVTVGGAPMYPSKNIIQNVEGDWLTVEAKGNTLSISDAKGNVSKVTIQNVFQSNGVIQVIDTVLLPS